MVELSERSGVMRPSPYDPHPNPLPSDGRGNGGAAQPGRYETPHPKTLTLTLSHRMGEGTAVSFNQPEEAGRVGGRKPHAELAISQNRGRRDGAPVCS